MNTKGFEVLSCLCLAGNGRMSQNPQGVPHYWTVYVAVSNGTVEGNNFSPARECSGVDFIG